MDLEKGIEILKKDALYDGLTIDDLEALEIVLKKYEKVLFDLKLKNKMIDLMSEHLTSPINDREWVKRYFEERAREVL